MIDMDTVNEGTVLVVAVEEEGVYENELEDDIGFFHPENEVAKLICLIARKATLTRKEVMRLDESENFVVKFLCHRGTATNPRSFYGEHP